MPIASAFLLCVVDRETGRQETGRKMRDRQGDGRQTGRQIGRWETGRQARRLKTGRLETSR